MNKTRIFAVIGLAHPHIYGMCNGLIDAGAKLKYVYDDDENLVKAFINTFPNTKIADSIDEILSDNDVTLIASAEIPSKRADLAIKCMNAEKDFFVDKVPFTLEEDYNAILDTIKKTKRNYYVFYSESITNAVTLYAFNLIKNGVIGDVFHIEGTAPHRHNPSSRPAWFYEKQYTGGIITDIGSQQIHQFLKICDTTDVEIDCARIKNYNNPQHTQFDDFGDFSLTAKNGITGYFRIDWSSPDGLGTWGDVRLIVEGSKGHMELRKNCNVGFDNLENHIIIVTNDGVKHEIVKDDCAVTLFSDIVSGVHINPSLDLKTALIAIKTQKIAER